MRRVAFTVDVEQDAPPFMSTWRGMEEGMPQLLGLLQRHGVRATFFVTGIAASRYPEVIAHIARSHEVGCHGYEHERFDRLSPDDQRARILTATDVLQDITGEKPAGFRAPNFRFNRHTLQILEEAGYIYDASTARYHSSHRHTRSSLVQIANTLPSSVLRLPPRFSRIAVDACLRCSPLAVLDHHPWELVRMSGLRLDIRFATGNEAFERLDSLLGWLLAGGVRFVTMREVAAERTGH
jgi:peptidoglycan/xylan/chitin deacetylase (PgdA/CDA1 family)